jgi:hypothetical protein
MYRMLLLSFALTCLAQEPLPLVRRIYVDNLNGNGAAIEMRDLLITALQNTKRFQITENPERAEVVLRGTANEDIFTDSFHSSESINARAYVGRSSTSTKSTSSRSPADMSVGQSENTVINERKHQSLATVRLVSKDGDVIWSTTKESTGAKFRGANADVAEKIVKQLLSDIEATGKPKT